MSYVHPTIQGMLKRCITNLDEVSKHLLAERTGEATIHCMHSYMLFEQVQPFKGLRA